MIAAALVAPTVTVTLRFAVALPLVAVSWYEVVSAGLTEAEVCPVMSPSPLIVTLAVAGSTENTSLVD